MVSERLDFAKYTIRRGVQRVPNGGVPLLFKSRNGEVTLGYVHGDVGGLIDEISGGDLKRLEGKSRVFLPIIYNINSIREEYESLGRRKIVLKS
jgi:hypothetical protein